MSGWCFADVWEEVAAAAPDRPAQIQGQRVISWRDFDRRANALAAHLLAAGVSQQGKLAAYLFNCPEYLESYYAAFKIGLVPVNANYRYETEELFYLFDNADAEVIVFHAGFAPKLEAIKDRLPGVKAWIAVEDEGAPIPDWATEYESIAAKGADRVVAPWGRGGDDLLLLYTGGTTGMPKGVMWRQDDLFQVLGAGGNALAGIPPFDSPADAGTRIRTGKAGDLELPPPSSLVAACPLMHGTAQFGAFGAMNTGGAIISLPSRRFDAEELWREVDRLKARSVSIVGNAFAAPMLDALDNNPGRWDISSLVRIGSSGVVWSHENKQGLLRHLPPGCVLFDSLGSSEAVGLGVSQSTAGAEASTAQFMVGPNAAVFDEAGQRVEPGSGRKGLVAVGGFIPVGYYKDPEKSARTFQTFEGRRWSVPGDFAEVNADGSIRLLGRGSQVINTGGEKVFPEEVEEALKTHPAVRDAVVVGIPDARFNERICAVVEASGDQPSLAELSAHVKGRLAAYKAPRDLVFLPINRAANGKVDYKGVRQRALEALQIPVT
ncbi:fatty-acyl-CoA synthase [Caulobacter ginsengisoli]|uniref:Fatty-acyl-CoA synthase n=1 Tax=Caulobacter ginsengisoli TaxID=400775 RepID=A0ABU0IWY1_9CAUL|nr:AMP-binding protein [Caulobacter ginsengisoli]MDQ0466526.1 fatty-acyl-CoA synthase [Caulobacter ginsengisoli]